MDKETPLHEAAKGQEIVEEELIWEGSPSWKVDFARYVGYSLLALVLAIAMAVGAAKGGYLGYGLLGAVVVLLVFALYLGWITLVRRATQYRITNLSVQIRRGIFTTEITTLETWRIRDSAYYQSFWEKLLGIAHIVLHTQDVDTPVVQLEGLPADQELYERIKKAYIVARQHRNVLGLVE